MQYKIIPMVLPKDEKEAQILLDIIQAAKIRYVLTSNSRVLQVALQQMALVLNKELIMLHKLKLEEKKNGHLTEQHRRHL